MSAYVPLNWVDNVTDANAANMNHLEAGVAAALPKVAGAADPITGTVYFGALADTNLYRASANVLKTDSVFQAGLDVYAQMGLSTQIRVGNSSGNPTVEFGSALDTRIYRSAANTLKTDGGFFAVGQLVAWLGGAAQVSMGDAGGGASGLLFGSASDTRLYRSAAQVLAVGRRLDINADIGGGYVINLGWYSGAAGGGLTIGGDMNLYRAAAGTLKTDGIFQATSDIYAQMGAATQVRMGNSSGLATIEFGSAFDTRIYRASSQNLNTDGNFSVAYTLQVDRLNGGGRVYFGSAQDTNIYRYAVGQLATDNQFYANKGSTAQIRLGSNSGTPTIWFGNATGGGDTGDVFLYRIAAGSLRTDASLGVQVTAGFTVDSAGAVHGTSFPVSSDERLKTDIEPLEGSLDKLLRLRGVSFLWREDHGTHRDYTKDANREITPRQIGVIAQDVLAEFPEIVHQWPVFAQQYDEEEEATLSVETGETRYAVDYGRVVPILIEALREVDERLHVLEEKK